MVKINWFLIIFGLAQISAGAYSISFGYRIHDVLYVNAGAMALSIGGLIVGIQAEKLLSSSRGKA